MMDYQAFSKLTYGLYIISSEYKGKKNGYIGNTVFQVTAEPPQIAISCNKDNYTCDIIKKSEQFSISVLKQDVKSEIIGEFGFKSGKNINKFINFEQTTSAKGTPVVKEDTIAWFDCVVKQTMDVGSHIIFVGEIIENKLLLEDAEPLTYEFYKQIKKGLAPKNAPTYIDTSKIEDKKMGKQLNEGGKYRCLACGYIYDPALGDPESGIAPGTAFNDLPDDWLCPTCGSPKSMFEEWDD